MKRSRLTAILHLHAAGVVDKAAQHRQAARLRAEWETFLAQSDFAFREDALSHDLVSLEDAGFEEPDVRAIFGFEPDGVSSGVRCVCDVFYEEDSAEFMAG